MKSNPFVLIILLVCVFFNACKKDDATISDVPELTSVTATPSEIKEFQDSIIFTIAYRDGNGDLGENDPDIKNLFITDNRVNVTYQYRIDQLSPDGSDIAIEGNLNVTLKGIAITDGSTQQDVSYSVYVVDRAGQKSNSLTTATLVIKKP
jgi:hypothetical protein